MVDFEADPEAGPYDGPVRDRDAMIAGMEPVARPGAVAFVALGAGWEAHLAEARAVVREEEGVTLVLPLAHPAVPGSALPMRQITLNVHSALDGVGLTAAVAEALASADIPCNVIAGFHHDHLFVPAGDADRAVAILQARAAR
ncbi:MAG: ACT domain-containing protein [Pseudomonadota bacterium]